MKKSLGNWIIDRIVMSEQDVQIKTVVGVFPGRFQIFGSHHFKIFKWFQNKFGSKNTFIATSGKVELPRSPFTFNEKKKIINKYGIKNIIQVKSPYRSEEILGKYDPNTTAAVFLVGEKDAQRLKSNFYLPWKGKAEYGYRDHAYFLIMPHISLKVPGYGEMSGTSIRRALGSSNILESERKKLFKGIFGFWDDKIYKLVTNKLIKLSEKINEFLSEFEISNILLERSSADGKWADDGPKYFYGNKKTYRKQTAEMAERLGFNVINYIMGDDEFEVHDTSYPNGPVSSISYFPAGVPGVKTSNNLEDLTGKKAYWKWVKHIRKIALSLGWTFIDFMKKEDAIKLISQSEKEPNVEKEVTQLEEQQLFTKNWWKNKIEEDLIQDIKYSDHPLERRILLQCGGAAGHMTHPFEDNNLTFGDLKKIIDNGLQGKLDLERSVEEKTDGQALAVTWKDGKLKSARNKSQIKNPLDIKGVENMFAGRGDIQDGFVFAMKDLQNAIGKLKDKQRDKIFENGKIFMNLEIIYPSTENVINYDKALLQFHGATRYDENGNPIEQIKDSARMLQGMIKQTNQDVQKHFKIEKPIMLTIDPHQDYSKKRNYFFSKLKKLQNEFKLKDNDTLGLYHQNWWENFISIQANKFGASISNNVLVGLTKRWAFFDKKYAVHDMKRDITEEKFLKWAIKFDKKNHQDQVKKNMFRFETLILEFGAEVLKNTRGFLSANPNKTVQKIKDNLKSAIKDIQKGSDIKNIKILHAQMKKVEAIGGFDAIVPSEGLVFVFKGNVFKLTGLFAPVNRILGLLKF